MSMMRVQATADALHGPSKRRSWAMLAVEGRGERRMHAGDAMCLCAGIRHDVPAHSHDYVVLEMCVPADYDTTATPPPAVP